MDATTYSPESLAQLFAAWDEVPHARLLAGGTDLLVRLRDEDAWPPLIDISRIAELQGIAASADTIRIGALATYSEIEQHHELAAHAAALVQAAQLVGSPQIRNRGTLGGNLANASPAGDTIPPLYVLDARVVLVSSTGTRHLPVDEFYTGPGKSLRNQCEIITAVELPVEPARRSVFMRLGQRQALAISKVSVAVSLVHTDGSVPDIRIALGAVAPTVVRARRAEDALRGHTLDNDAIVAACTAVESDAAPISDLRSNARYRRAMCGELLNRALHNLQSPGD